MSRMIYVAGEAGAGKTTLVRGALQMHSDKLQYLTTYTTRPPRGKPEDELGYVFVARNEYEQIRNASKRWDHGEFYGNWYGADVAAAHRTLESGKSLIVTTMPDVQTISEMAQTYGIEPLTIYIKTARDVRARRLLGRVALNEIARINEDDGLVGFAQFANRVFEPVNVVEQDIHDFSQIIGECIDGK